MREIVTAAEMKALDSNTIQQAGIPSLVLMERAALRIADELTERLKEKDRERILVVCGTGNNGGDGLAVTRLLQQRGFRVWYYILGNEEKMTAETACQFKTVQYYQVPRANNLDLNEYTTIVDAIFGVGLSRPVEGKYGEVISELNQASAYKVAVDIPSGIDADTGFEKGVAFRADLTVTFAFRKRGLCFYPGRMYGGEIIVADIGIYSIPGERVRMHCLEQKDLEMLPERIPYGNKGTFGKVLLVAGCEGMCGAAYLSAAAVLKCSARMVKIQTVEANRIPLQTLLPEAMISCDFDESRNQAMLDWCDVIVIGPGLGVGAQSRERAQWFLSRAAMCGKPVVLDADGLNLLSVHEEWKRFLGENVIVTPHIGEMSRLCGKAIGDIQDCLTQTASDYAKETNAVCVLKDACTVIADASGEMYLNLSGNAGMATAGSGDVLSGVLAGILCMYLVQKKKPSPVMLAALGVYIHGAAGDLAAQTVGQRGMTAGDIIRFLPGILK